MTRWQTLCAVDFDKAAAATYRANFPGVDVRCCTVAEAIPTLPDCDVILGGPPCQGFSLAGKGKGVDDSRNGWPDFIAAVAAKLPRMFLAENVPGMLTEKHLPYSRQVFCELESLGYVVEKRQLDAVNYGVPQFRKRVWFWGIRADLYAAGVRHRWPEPTHEWPWGKRGMFSLLPAVTVGQALGIGGMMETGSKKREDGNGVPRGPLVKSVDNPSFAIDGRCPDVHEETTTGIRRIRGSGVVRRDHGIGEPCPSVMAPTGGKAGLCRVMAGASDKPSRKHREREITAEPCVALSSQHKSGDLLPRVHEYRWSPDMLRKHPPASPASPVLSKYYKGGAEGLVQVDAKHPVRVAEEPGRTLNSGGDGHSISDSKLLLSVDGRTWDSRHPTAAMEDPAPVIRARSPRDAGRCTENVVTDGLRVRRLTPLECARLQSCPDDMLWPDGISKTAMYKIIGNGWSSGIAAALSRAFAEADPDSRTVVDLFCGGGLGALGWHQRYWQWEGNE